MGNQESIQFDESSTHQPIDFDQSSMTYLHHVENANLVKCYLGNEIPSSNHNPQLHNDPSPLFFLQKIFVSDSQQQYKLLSKYLQKSSLFSMQPQSSQIIKIVKIYQESEKGICSNRYFIKALFEYSDITLRQQIKIRASNKLCTKKSTVLHKNHFRYEDLCSIMFACISALFTVQKMKNHFKAFVEKNLNSKEQSFRHLQQFLNQFRYNIPLNLDRLIIMQDGTIKVMHPLLIDHDNRINHSSKFFYSPQKMKDFVMEDGIRGRIFQTALIILQCALLESTQRMSSVYNGYCINESVLKEKIRIAEEIYSNMEQINGQDLKLFGMLKKMTLIDPQKRIGLDQSINEAENLFQVNKKLKQSANLHCLQKQAIDNSNRRMKVQELQFIPYHRIAVKNSPIKNSTCQSTNNKFKDDEKTTARLGSHQRTEAGPFRQNPQIQVSHFDPHKKKQSHQYNQESSMRNPLESLLICNNDHEVCTTKNQEKCLESLIGKGSDLYNTQKYNFLQSKFQYQKFYFNPLKNSRIEQGSSQKNSSHNQSVNSQTSKNYKYKKLIEQSARNSQDKRNIQQFSYMNRQRLLRRGPRVKYDKSLITNSKFMQMDQIYEKYDFITKTSGQRQMSKNNDSSNSFISIKKNQASPKVKAYNNNQINDIPFTFSFENSVKGSSTNSIQKKMNETNKSEVIQKITPEHIYEKLKRNKMLR